MFKSRKLTFDAARPKRREERLSPKRVGRSSAGKVPVRTMPDRPGIRQVPDEYKTIERGRRRGWGFLVFLIILFAAAAAGFYYWNNQPPRFQGDSIAFAVTAPESIVSGDEVTYHITYTNNDVVALRSVELDVQWPEGFYFNGASHEPQSETATTWALGPMDPGQQKELSIMGQLVGLKDQRQEAVFRLSYQPANIKSDFEEVAIVAVVISDARINLELTSADKVIAGSSVPFTATVTNMTDADIEALDIEIIPPSDMDITASDPALDGGHWRGSLRQDAPLTLTATAAVSNDASGLQHWVVEINETLNGEVRRILRKELPVTPVRPEFGIELKINGQGADFDIGYGEALNYQLALKNNSDSILNDIRVTALLDSDVIDRKTIQASGLANNETITWTKEHVEKLGGLQPGEEALITWRADLLQAGTIGRATVDNVITVSLEGLVDWKQSSQVFVVSVGEGVAFNQSLYWELGGQQVGSGNLPPVTNERTEYLVVWSLDSGNQEYDSVNVSAILPQKVIFVETDDVDEGALSFDAETSRLQWQIDNFSTTLLPLKAAFIVRLVPRDEDEGTVMTVINPPTLVASGSETFQSKGFSLTTANVIAGDFEGDPGTVVE